MSSPPPLGAISSGIRYQVRFFWRQALAMLYPTPVVRKVVLEHRVVDAVDHRLVLLAERIWRRLDGYELLPLVRAGVKFKDGAQLERNDGTANKGKRGKIAA